MKGVKYIFALHVIPPSCLPTGTVLLKSGAMYTGSAPVEVIVKGKGGHASSPEASIDPVPIAAQIVSNIQSVVTRRFAAGDAPVVTITNFSTSSDSFNVIADSVNIKISIRYRNSEVVEPLKQYLTQVFNHTCEGNGATCVISWKAGYDVTVNDEEAFKISEKVAQEMIGEEKIVRPTKPLGPSEDFSAYLKCCPGNYYCVGIYNEAEGCVYNNHHPLFKVDEEVFKVGVKMHFAHIQSLLM
ncbi:amidohydrolase [Angomonas deanei]|nr:amidohydrolase [Angomonas deanei]EPY32853.1 amidohydrolase [Angomonas deanei]EPY36838.1 amidohydrolase [Angomonas deanei]|eukprot:EPY27550.1 amidohydrolase [Angomonas deanei]